LPFVSIVISFIYAAIVSEVRFNWPDE
jgi:hypothetical protein